jgi:hypothetical protein
MPLDATHVEITLLVHLEDVAQLTQLASELAIKRARREGTMLNPVPRKAKPVPPDLHNNELLTFDDVKIEAEYLGIVEREKQGKGFYIDLGIHEVVHMSDGGERRINGLIPHTNVPQGTALLPGDKVYVRVMAKYGTQNKSVMLSLIRKAEN